MKRIVIIGNSAAGVSAAECIRQHDKESKITIVSAEPFLAYERRRLLDFMAGKIKERELYWRNQDFYKNNGLELLLERQVVEANLAKKKVVFKDRDSLEFDFLVVASGSRVELPSVKGIQKEGVVAFSGLKEAKYIVDNLPVAHTAIVVGSDGTAAALAGIIASKRIEVKFFGLLAHPMEGVEVVADNPISEIIGEGEARAVRLMTNKVIGASLIIYTEPKKPCLDFLRDTEIKIDRGILVDERMRTSVDFVFAAGDCAQSADQAKIYNWESALKEGQNAGSLICQM